MNKEHFDLRVQAIPRMSIPEWIVMVRTMPNMLWSWPSQMVIETDDGLWVIKGGIKDAGLSQYLPEQLNAAWEVFGSGGTGVLIHINAVGEDTETREIGQAAALFYYSGGSRITVQYVMADGDTQLTDEYNSHLSGPEKDIIQSLNTHRINNGNRRREA